MVDSSIQQEQEDIFKVQQTFRMSSQGNRHFYMMWMRSPFFYFIWVYIFMTSLPASMWFWNFEMDIVRFGRLLSWRTNNCDWTNIDHFRRNIILVSNLFCDVSCVAATQDRTIEKCSSMRSFIFTYCKFIFHCGGCNS